MGSHELIAAYSVSEAYMIGEVEVENLKAIMDVSNCNRSQEPCPPVFSCLMH